jgi:mono/diheme cytochrome c family protein
VDGDPNNGFGIYQQNCAACHGENGEGRIGAQLAVFDALNPGANVLQTVSEGRPGTVMPAWHEDNGGPLTDQEVQDVAAYVLSLHRDAAPAGGEQTIPSGSSLPLIVIGALILILILALAASTTRRQPPAAPGGEH